MQRGATNYSVPTLETMLCVNRGLAYERHTYVVLEDPGMHIGADIQDC